MSEKRNKKFSDSTSPTKKKRPKISDHPAFGMWKDRFSDKEVPAFVRSIRRGRFEKH